MKHYVYLIKSDKDGSIYTGCTDNIEKRLDEHNAGLSQYTKTKMPWMLKWYAVFFQEADAFSFEKYLKTGSGRAFINKRVLGK
jgi:predicted GIY-YIG superfamily endonuclease